MAKKETKTKQVSTAGEWLTNEEAAEKLKLKPRSIQALGKQGLLERKAQITAAGRTTYLVSRASIDRYKAGLADNRPLAAARTVQALAAPVPPATPEIPDILAGAVKASAAELEPHMWLTMDEAAAYVRLPRTWLEHMIRVGKLPAMDTHQRVDGRWRVQVGDLERIGAETQTSLARSA